MLLILLLGCSSLDRVAHFLLAPRILFGGRGTSTLGLGNLHSSQVTETTFAFLDLGPVEVDQVLEAVVDVREINAVPALLG